MTARTGRKHQRISASAHQRISVGSLPRHPSGKPVSYELTKGRSIWRVPDDGYVTPRLRKQHGVNAIGFMHKFDGDGEE